MPATGAQKRYYCGADLHGNNVFLSVCDEKGDRVMKKRVKADLQSVKQVLEPYLEHLHIVAVESTFNWYWFVDGLRAAGVDVRLANPARMQQYSGLKVSDDASDASWLAEQARLGILPECYVYPAEVRPIRDLLRRRMFMVRQRTGAILTAQSLFAREAWSWPGTIKFKKWTDHEVQALGCDPFTAIQLSSLLELVRTQDQLTERIEREVLKAIKKEEGYKSLQQIPGIGPILGMLIMLESGNFQRFPSAGNYASYCRTVQSQRISNDKNKGVNNRKNGNRYLSWAFAEAAVFAIRFRPAIQSWHERKKRRSNAPKALRALSCKLAKVVWHVMNGKDYREEMLFN